MLLILPLIYSSCKQSYEEVNTSSYKQQDAVSINPSYINLVEGLIDTASKMKIYNMYTDMKEYRLGDMVTIKSARDDGRKYYMKNFPLSIANMYMQETNDNKNYDKLFNIVKQKSNDTNIPTPNLIVIHIRLGDVIENNTYDVKDLLLYNTINVNEKTKSEIQYIYPLSYFNKIKQIKNINNVVLICGSHKKVNFTKSSIYLNCVKLYLETLCFNVSLRIGKNADDDFIYISNSHYYLNIGGGYGKILEEMVRRNCGTIIE